MLPQHAQNAHGQAAASPIQGVQPQMPEYKPEDMVFEMEEEKIPVYNPPKPADSDDYSDGEGAEEENGIDGEHSCMTRL